VRRVLANLAVIAASLALSLACAEVASWYLLPQWAPENASRTFWRYDERLGWSNRPGASGVQLHRDFAPRIEINAAGQRDRDYPMDRVPGRCRMLALGDSYAWGYGVEREQIWHELVEARRPEWEIVNAGVPGYGTDQELLYLEERGLALRPDAVVLLFYANDVLENLERSSSGYFKPYFELGAEGTLALHQVPVPRGGVGQRFERWLRFHTYLLFRLYRLPSWLAAVREEREGTEAHKERRKRELRAAREEERQRRRRERLAAGGRPAERRAGTAGAVAEAAPRDNKYDVDLSLTLAMLERMDRSARAGGARFFVVAAPLSDPPRERLLAALRERSVASLALDPAFDGRSDIRFPHDPHWTPSGHVIAADAVERFLVAEGVFDAPGCGLSAR
jgi:lysophospholipase L1-like esterase